MERETKSNKRGKRLLYIMEDGTEVEVGLDIQRYQNGNLFIGLTTGEDGYHDQFAKLTVNSCGIVPEYCGHLDVNNVVNAEKFVSENRIGEFTGHTMRLGYCEYPLYQFYPSVIRNLCPEQAKEYESCTNSENSEGD